MNLKKTRVSTIKPHYSVDTFKHLNPNMSCTILACCCRDTMCEATPESRKNILYENVKNGKVMSCDFQCKLFVKINEKYVIDVSN